MWSVATWRPSLARARSLRSDRATFFGLFSDVSCFFRRALQRDKIGAAPYYGCLRTVVEGIKPFIVRLGVKFSAVCKLAGFLKTLEYWQRDKFWDLVSRFLILCLEMLEISALGLGQDLGSQLIRLVWLEPSISPRTVFKPPGSADQKFWVSFIALLSLCRMYESNLYEMAKSV
ncbi:hypothetical protein F2Q70_00011653 [Brassica cretica]|uniref:Uncharacterized protein n=1 Tax=Brassica cretica TaxID=69181 RepID=A0A8S9M3J8_BRACR|nr:hypothetical protein F2Q70_00011653 [Brassica cretica]